MNLGQLEGKLSVRLDRIERRVRDFAMSVNLGHTSEPEWMYLEGLVSTLWQSWCHFCRDVVMHSATGCSTVGGAVLAASVVPANWQRVSYLAMQAKKKSPVTAGRTNSIRRFEPTWGDVNSLAAVISITKPANRTVLLSAFGLGQRVVHLQCVRNAAAHRNSETMKEVLKLAPAYNLPRSPRHPIEAVCWEEVTSGDYAIMSWASEMRTIAQLAVQ